MRGVDNRENIDSRSTMKSVTSVLLLAGTTEATKIANVLVRDYHVDVLSSLAGVTLDPAPRAGRVRSGGFGGVEGLANHLRTDPVDAILDATHPFAAVMPFHVAAAAAKTATPACRVLRPAWTETPEDQWTVVPDLAGALGALANFGSRRVMLSVGRQGTGAFVELDAWFLIRAIEMPDILPARHRLVLSRGPFDLEAERVLLSSQRIDALVTKNAGGASTSAKLVAARELGIPVVMIARPAQPEVTTVSNLDQALEWLDGVVGLGSPSYERGV